MAAPKTPARLGPGGRKLWRDVVTAHELDAPQRVQLEEACRAKDRLDKLDALLCGTVDTWAEIQVGSDGGPVSLRIDAALKLANETANLVKQLLAALRLPDASGKRPQFRGPRGAQKPTVPGGGSAAEKAASRWGA